MIKFRQQYPDWLYQSIPPLYLSGGLLVMASLPTAMMFVSGLALISIGVMVWVLRYRYRRPFNASSGYINVLDWSQGGAPNGGHFQIAWRSMFDGKNPVLTAQHRRLFGLGNELVNAVLRKKSKPEVELLFTKFVEHMTDHFQAQELAMAQIKSPYFKEHQREHRGLLSKAEDLGRRFHDNELTSRELQGFVTYDVIVEHLLKEEFKSRSPRRRTSDSVH